jgi:hypothetical protein
MKNPFRLSLLLLLFFAGLHTSVFADQSRVWLKINILLNDNTKRSGYISVVKGQINLVEDEKGYCYYEDGKNVMRLQTRGNQLTGIRVAETDYHFHRFVQRHLYDTLELYQQIQIIKLPENGDLIVGTQNCERILPGKIKDLTVELFFLTGYEFIETRLHPDDALWLNGSVHEAIELGGYGICIFRAILFSSTPSARERIEEAMNFFKKLSEQSEVPIEQYPAIEKETKRLFENLRKEKILVIGLCSC